MSMKLFSGLFLFLMLVFVKGFSIDVPDVGFPFKLFAFQAARVPLNEFSKVTVTKNTASIIEFSYGGKAYKGNLMTYGAIYLEREGMNPLLVSFDVREFRMNGNFRY